MANPMRDGQAGRRVAVAQAPTSSSPGAMSRMASIQMRPPSMTASQLLSRPSQISVAPGLMAALLSSQSVQA